MMTYGENLSVTKTKIFYRCLCSAYIKLYVGVTHGKRKYVSESSIPYANKKNTNKKLSHMHAQNPEKEATSQKQ